MDENAGNNKVLGLESAQYVKLCYGLILIAGGLGLVVTLLGFVGLGGGGSGLLAIIGLAGLVMALIGWVAFGKDFTVIELDHLRFLSLMFIVFYVVGLGLAAILGVSGLLWAMLSFVLGAGQLLLTYLGFRLWIARREVTVVDLQEEFESLKSYLQKRSDL